MSDELMFAIKVARKAGELALTYYGKDIDVEDKSDATPVTEADKAVDKYIRERLLVKFPDYAVLSEENIDDFTRLNNQYLWCVDPIDGTRHFMQKDGFFGIHIGLVVNEKAILGVVYRPTTDELYYAETGRGAFVSERKNNPRQIQVARESDIKKMKGIITSNKSSGQGKWIKGVGKELGVFDFIYAGSVGVSTCMVARGDLVIYGYGGYKSSEWDTCAPEVILKEAGGKFTDACGRELLYNQKEVKRLKGFLATNGAVHDELLRVTSKMLC
jgi:3'(2'), 5'-bisphosphate nucleotidase